MRAEVTPDFGFYYPGQYWHSPDWIKNLVLFFDGIAMLIPEYMPDVGSFDDYPIMAALKEHGLFSIVRPEEVVGSGRPSGWPRRLATSLPPAPWMSL